MPELGGVEWFRDPAGQNERTSLSWQRTALSLAAAAAVVVRLTMTDLGAWVLVVFVISLALSGLIFLSSRWEYRRRAQLPAPAVLLYEGTRAALLAANVILLGLTELLAINLS